MAQVVELTIEAIAEMTIEQEAILTKLTSKEEFVNGVSAEESKERTKLIFLKQANLFKTLATDDFVDKESDENYEELAIKNYQAYLNI